MLRVIAGSAKDVLKIWIKLETEIDMETSGWIVMLTSVGSVVTLLVYCLVKVFTLPPIKDEE